MLRKLCFALPLFMIVGTAFGQVASQAEIADGWRSLPDSDNNDFSIFCTRAKGEVVYEVSPTQPRGFQYARHVMVKYGTDGHLVALNLLRGMGAGADHDVFIVGSDVSCRIQQQ